MKKSKSINELLKVKHSGEPYWGPFLRPKEKIILVAPPKKGKTFFGIQLATSVACGIDFLGFKTTQAKVLYLNLEMDEERMATRIGDIATSMNADDDLLDQNLSMVSDCRIRLDSKKSRKEIIDEIKNKSIKVIVVDPLQRSIKGSDSNERDLRKLINEVDRILKETNTTCLIIHHTPKVVKSKESVYAPRGHSILSGWADTILYLDGQKLKVSARTTSLDEIRLFFKHPVWYARDGQTEVERVQSEIKSILEKTPGRKKSRMKLQGKIKSTGWSFKEAQKRLEE